MTEGLAAPPREPAADTGEEDLVEGAEHLPQDIREGNLAPDELTAAQAGVDPNADVPESGDDDGDDVEDEVDEAIAREHATPNP